MQMGQPVIASVLLNIVGQSQFKFFFSYIYEKLVTTGILISSQPHPGIKILCQVICHHFFMENVNTMLIKSPNNNKEGNILEKLLE